MRRRLKQLLIALGALVGVVILLFGALYAALQTSSGQSWAAARLTSLLSSPTQGIAIERVAVALPGPFRIEGLTLGDRFCLCLRVDRIEAAPSWSRILAGEVALDRIA